MKPTNFARATGKTASQKAYATADTTNHEGNPAWKRPLKERALQLLLTNTLGNTFYVGASELAAETDATYRAILKEDPEYFAKAIVYARNRGFMRLQPIVGLVYLSTHQDADGKKSLFHQTFDRTIRTPHDLSTFIEWCKTSGIRPGNGLGRAVKTAVNRWLNNMTQYHAIKYPLNGQWSMRNILRLSKPVARDETQRALFEWVVDGTLSEGAKELDQVAAFEALKATTDPKEQRDLIEAGRLPHEVVTGAVSNLDTETWSYIMRQMPHMALLRNLNTLEKHGVFNTAENISYAAAQLSDREAVQRAKVLPFQYYQAFKAYEGRHNQIVGAIGQALENSFVNLPEIPGNVVIANDVSGSMGSAVVTRNKGRPVMPTKASMRYCDIAGIFAAALVRKSPTSTVIKFDDRALVARVNPNDSIITNSGKLAGAGGGTDLGAPIRLVNSQNIPMDTFIGITDNMEWMNQYNGYWGNSAGFHAEWKNRRNKNAQAFLVRIDPYEGAAAPPTDPSVNLIYGWSADALKFIALKAKGVDSQVKYVENLRFTNNTQESEEEE